MVEISLNDPNVAENSKAIMSLKKSGLFTDDEIQKMYDEQVRSDRND